MRSPNGDDLNFLRFAWTFQICRGIVLWSVLALICMLLQLKPVKDLLPLQSVFADRQFPAVTGVLGLSLILSGFESTAIHLNARRLNLRPILFLDTISRAISLPLMVYLAWISGSVWAVVFGSLLSGGIRLLMTHLFVPGPQMSFRWDPALVREFLTFGRWITVSSTASFISSQGDRLFIGLLMSSSTLGVYSIAKTLAETMLGLFDRLNSSLAVPVLSEVIRREPSNLKGKYYKFRIPFDLAVPFLGGVVLTSGSLLIHLLYDPRYEQAGFLLQILSVSFLMLPVGLIATAFPLVGEPKVSAILSIVQAASLFCCMTVGFWFGSIVGTVTGIAVHRIIPSILLVYLSANRGWTDAWKELRIFPTFVAGALVGEIATKLAQLYGF
jgi:O-antigen/teichoic acid export membrane protein